MFNNATTQVLSTIDTIVSQLYPLEHLVQKVATNFLPVAEAKACTPPQGYSLCATNKKLIDSWCGGTIRYCSWEITHRYEAAGLPCGDYCCGYSSYNNNIGICAETCSDDGDPYCP